MLVHVNGVRLFVDVENSRLVPEGDRMREKPTLLLLHGGPGFDHSGFKPVFSALSDVAQIIYYDHRGNGRSENGVRSKWTLAQWGEEVKGLCDTLGIEKPIVLGMSFGGYVAQAYAPDNEQGRMNFLPELGYLRCPVLVMAGEHDPISPMRFSETLVAALPPGLVQFERFTECGHGVFGDQPGRALAVLRTFMTGV